MMFMDEYGIERCWTSDHYMPWWYMGASGGAAWPWLGAALTKTQSISIGTGVIAPITKIPSSRRGSSVCYTCIYVS